MADYTYTPLDSLKETVIRVNELLEFLEDDICGAVDTPVQNDEWADVIDTIRKTLVEALHRHVPEAYWDGIRPVFGPAAKVYDDGSVIVADYRLEQGHLVSYYPRLDGPLDEYLQKFLPGPILRALGDVDAADAGRVDEIIDAALAGDVTVEQLEVVAHVEGDRRKIWADVDADDLAYLGRDRDDIAVLIAQVKLHGSFGEAFAPSLV